MRRVYTADDPIRAYIVKNVLESAGISVVVVGEWLFPLRGPGASLSDDSLPEVWVINDEDAPAARELMEQLPVPNVYPAKLWVRRIALFLLLWPIARSFLPCFASFMRWRWP